MADDSTSSAPANVSRHRDLYNKAEVQKSTLPKHRDINRDRLAMGTSDPIFQDSFDLAEAHRQRLAARHQDSFHQTPFASFEFQRSEAILSAPALFAFDSFGSDRFVQHRTDHAALPPSVRVSPNLDGSHRERNTEIEDRYQQENKSQALPSIRKVWVCDISWPEEGYLANCIACQTGKKYGNYHDAAAHLWSVHFKSQMQMTNGTWPDLRQLKENWMKEVEEVPELDIPLPLREELPRRLRADHPRRISEHSLHTGEGFYTSDVW